MTNANPIETVSFTGIELDLTASEEEIGEVFVKLLWREGRLLRGGITCELKDGGQDCLHCPVATLDGAEPLSRLCRLGKDQSTVEKRFLAKNNERLGPVREIAAMASAASEILPQDLTEVGW
jgi:hypothetical protein